MHKYNEDGKLYYGKWQFGDTVKQLLEGPIGEGAIDYPNGDRFEGFFHLSYACINGPAYAARGKYLFANGDVVDDCWIDGNDRLMGVFRMKCHDGTNHITMWIDGKKWGLEVIKGEQVVVVNYEDDVEVQRWDDRVSYTYTENADAENLLVVNIPGGRTVTQEGGKVEHGASHPRCETRFDNGNMFRHLGTSIYRYMKPWNGHANFYDASTGKSIDGKWEEGKQVDERAEWKYDIRGCKEVMIPTDPFGNKLLLASKVWDGYIEYGYGVVYEGEMKDGLPEGKGTFTNNQSVEYKAEPRRYEGSFHQGLAHGEGIYSYPSAGIRQEGLWIEGKFIDEEAPAEPIMLHVEWSDDRWSMSGSSKITKESYDIVAKVGSLDIQGFHSVHIEEVRRNLITFKNYGSYMKVLTPGESIHFSNSIDGYEDHEGCVWNGDDYSITISWPVKADE